MRDWKKVLKQLSLEEKAKLCVGKNYWQTYDCETIHLPSLFMCDGPNGLRKQDIGKSSNSSLKGIKKAVCFPSGSTLASSWDRNLLNTVGSSLGKKAASENVDVLLAPSMNIKRTPLCGRNFEYYSEDPYLCGELAASFIKGVQKHHVAACPKHFAVNNQETKRKAINVILGERELREIYLYGFERAVRYGNPWCIMSSYNRINGMFPAQNHRILKEILRDEWGFDGVVISDWGAIDQIASSIAESFNLQMPGDGGYAASKITSAVKSGELKEEKLDEAVLRLLQLAGKTVEVRKAAIVTEEELHQTACEAAAESMVLLKNTDHILPLKKEDKVLVVGEMAVHPRYQGGGGSAYIQSFQVDMPLEYIGMLLPQVEYAEGYSGEEIRMDLLSEAEEKASRADKVVIFAGLPASYESEGYDRQSLNIPDNQILLIERLSKCNKNIIVVLSNGSAITMPWLHQVKAVLESYLSGEAMGRAVADLLYGLRNPSGKLAETFPVRLEDTPAFLNFPGENNVIEYKEGIFVGYRYYEKKKVKPLFPFGHGLSYTKFEYSNIRVNTTELLNSDTLEVSMTIKNVGDYYGKEVVQLYIGKKDSAVVRAVKELKAFDKVGLQPEESRTVWFELNTKDFSYYNSNNNQWIIESGIYQIYIGSSSKEIHLSTQVEVLSQDRVLLSITRNTSFGDVKDIQELGGIFIPFYNDMLSNLPFEFGIGDKDGQLATAMLRNMTFSSIASYVGSAANDEKIDALLKELNNKLDQLRIE